MTSPLDSSRRRFLQRAAALGVSGAALSIPARALPEKTPKAGEKEEENVSPAEDLMREHGVLKRVLLVYDEALRRLVAGTDLPPETIADSAGIIRTFIEDYHEKLEENFLFPRFRKAHRLVELVDVLTAQHQAGRRVTDTTIRLANAKSIRDAGEKKQLADSLRAFVRMYAPHEAREDTVLFPALRKIVSAHEYDALGDQFEDEEHRRFGEDGFEKYVDKIAAIEKKLGIYELAQFTPKA